MALISGIIPAYNAASRFLDQAIQSIRSQTFKDVELIVVDDASQDDTPSCVAAYPDIRYHRRPHNGGQAAARNDGARLASGQYLAFLDQDDLWEPRFLEETLRVFEEQPTTGIVHADGYKVDEHNHILEYDGAMKTTFSICQILRNGHDTATNGSLIRKSCFESVGGYDEQLSIWEDIDLAIRMKQEFPIVHLPTPLYRHRLYSRNVSRDISPERAFLARERFLNKFSPFCLLGTPAAQALSRDWAEFYSDRGKWCLRQGQVTEARRDLFRSLRYRPLSRKTIFRLLRTYFRWGKGSTRS